MKNFEVIPIGKAVTDETGFYIDIEEKYRPALKSLEGFSYIQVLWWFSHCDTKEARNILQAEKPYKKSPEIMGVFSTRSPIRPNPLALSVSQVLEIDEEKGRIQIAYIDADNGTPVLDIKPYTPSLDKVEEPEVPEWCSHWPKNIEQSEFFDWEDEFNF